MCVDYTDLNKLCPKDSYPLSRIDQLVDSTAGNTLLNFMDAYSGYNQILMHPNDKDKTAFYADHDVFCNHVIPFGLKNAGAPYQHLVNRIFKDQLSKTMEAYIDDMIVRSTESEGHLADLHEAFQVLKLYQMKLNRQKCTFGVTSGKFLGFMLTQRDIEANPEKIQAMAEMSSPRTIKEVQRLTGRLASLNCFLSKARNVFTFSRLSKPATHFDGRSNTSMHSLIFEITYKVFLASPLQKQESPCSFT